MSVIVRGMEMPDGCNTCTFRVHDMMAHVLGCKRMGRIIQFNYAEDWFVPDKTILRPDWCPLEEVKEDDMK